MSIPVNGNNPTPRTGARQQKLFTPKRVPYRCEICKCKIRSPRGGVLVDGDMRYVLCVNHMSFARRDPEHFRNMMRALRIGTPLSSFGVVV